MDFTATLADVSWGKGYEVGFRAGWLAHEELVESRERWNGDRSVTYVDRAATDPDPGPGRVTA